MQMSSFFSVLYECRSSVKEDERGREWGWLSSECRRVFYFAAVLFACELCEVVVFLCGASREQMCAEKASERDERGRAAVGESRVEGAAADEGFE